MEGIQKWYLFCQSCIQLAIVRKRLSEKVHATIPKGIVGGFQFSLSKQISKNGKRGLGRMFVRAKRKAKK